MKPIELSRRETRRYLLAHQGLLSYPKGGGSEVILSLLERLGCIQFDPLNIVGRNPDLVLQSRLPGYRPETLNDLLYIRRLLIDGWDKNMAIYRVEDWPYFQRYRDAARQRYGDRSLPSTAILPQVRRHIEERGPISSLDLEFDASVDWSWGPTRIARAALESMYSWGELIVHHRINTRKYYDFSRRHIPAEILKAPDPNVDVDEFNDWRILRRIRGIGLIWNRSGDAWLGLRGIKSRERQQAIERLAAQGKIVEVRVEDIEQPLVMAAEDRPILEWISVAEETAEARLIAPLDNLLWDRRFISDLFDFKYTWEVYKPVSEREYGYYVLPVLYGDRFIARFEPGRDRDSESLRIKQWWWEPGFATSKASRTAIRSCFRRFLAYLQLNSLVVDENAARSAGIEWLSTI